MDLRTAAHLLNGRVQGRSVSFPTPGHSPHDLGSSLTFDPAAPDGFLVNCFNGFDPLELKDYVRDRLGLRRFADTPAEFSAAPIPRAVADDRERISIALKLWQASRPAKGTIVEAYLASRGLTVTDHVIEADALRFHPACPFGKATHPAMIAVMRNIVTNEPTAVHRTALRSDGSGKATMADGGQAKRMLGTAAGAAVKLIADDAVTYGLGIAEGIENALTAICAGWLPVWACGSAGAIASFPVLAGIEALTIFADPEQVGMSSARQCAQRWQLAGTEATIVTPRGAGDWNDRMAAA